MVSIVIMNRLKNKNLVLLTFLLLNVFFVHGHDDGGREDHHKPHKLSLFNMLTTYCGKVKALVHQAHAYFFPPSIDFRRSDEGKEDAGGRGGATEKVKQAAASSLGKSEQTFEDSARTAAKIAVETMEKVKDRVKKSLSKRSAQPEQEL